MTNAPQPTSTTNTARYAVIGNPIAHSKSPRIHAMFAQSVGQEIDYTTRLGPVGNFAVDLDAFRLSGGIGANVTVPFKQEAFALATDASLRAKQAGAANFLIWRGDHWYCDNTDGAGLVRDIETNQRVNLRGKRVLLLGAGGASRGVIGPLLLREPQSLVVVNRTASRAVELVTGYSAQYSASAKTAQALMADGDVFDVVINATSSSLSGDLPLPESAEIFAPDALAYDMMYGAKPTRFMTWAKAQGASRTSDGLGMLVEQAAESYVQWKGVLPSAAPVIAQLRAELEASA